MTIKKPIMAIKENIIQYRHDLPCEVQLCRITNMTPHYHSKDLELIFCLAGNVTLVAGHQQETLHAGEVFSIDARDIHYLYSQEENLTLIFHLDLTNLESQWDFLRNIYFSCESKHCYPYQHNAMEQVKDMLLSLSHVFFFHRLHAHSLAPNQMSAYDHAANRLMDILLKYFNWYNYENHDAYMNMDIFNRYHRVLAYCHENYMRKINVSQLASLEHINRNYFSQFISKTGFKSFSLMIKYIRCFEAEHLLLETQLPVSEISYKCGFSDPKYFYSAFKLWWKCTPAEHRNRYEKYMINPMKVTYFNDAEAFEIIRWHIIKWHLEKSFNKS